MKSTIKVSLAVAAGAVGSLGSLAAYQMAISDWRPLVQDATRQALERRLADLDGVLNLPKVFFLGSNGN